MKKYTVTYLTPESNYATQGSMTVEAMSEKDAALLVCGLAGIRQMSIAYVRPARENVESIHPHPKDSQ